MRLGPENKSISGQYSFHFHNFLFILNNPLDLTTLSSPVLSSSLLLMEEVNRTVDALAPTHGDNAEKDGDVGEQLPEGPTDSHVLSQVEQEEKGLSQKAGVTSSITDIGWNQNEVYSDEPLVAGLSNEDLWMLIRRFDKVECGRAAAISFIPQEEYMLTPSSKSIMLKRYRMLRSKSSI